MTKNNYGIVRLFSGLFQGIVGKDNLCFIVRNQPEEAMSDAKEYAKRLNSEMLNTKQIG